MSPVRQIAIVSLAVASLLVLPRGIAAQQQENPPAERQDKDKDKDKEKETPPAAQQPAQPQQETAPAQPQPAAPTETAQAQPATPAQPPETAAAQTPAPQSAPVEPPAAQAPVPEPPAPTHTQSAMPTPPPQQDPPPTPPPAAQQPVEPPPAPAAPQNAPPPSGISGKWTVTVGKSLTIDSPLPVQRISVASGDLADAIAINPKEILINGKAPGETTVIIWQQGGPRLMYELAVRPSPLRLDAVRQQIARDFPDDEINITYDNDTAFVRGTVKDVMASDRVMAMVGTLGKSVNLLRVEMPPSETQILLKVRFASVDRSASLDLGINLASTAFNQVTSVGLGSALGTEIHLFRPDINLTADIHALEAKRMLEILAEPNVLAINGKEASFIAGGEFPFPMVQGGANVGTVSIMWREYGVRLNFLPTITPRGTIRLKVNPEVSSLDYTNAITISGFTVPGISTRRVNTEVELASGQTFVIAGLLDRQVTDSLSKIPGIGNIPIIGKLFQTKQVARNNTELLVIVTPEVVRPIPAGQAVPELKPPKPFLTNNTDIPMRHPGIDKTGPLPKSSGETMPVEQLIQQQRVGQPAPPAAMPPMQLVPILPTPPGNPGSGASPASGPGGPVK